MADLLELTAALNGLGRVLLGYSGGVDSSVLAAVGARSLGPDRFLAVIGRSPSYPEAQYRQAIGLARQFAVPLLEVDTDELNDPNYVANPTNRCFFCKAELWGRLGALAQVRGFDTVIDGTNADDLGDHRPGFAAGTARAIHSPLAELGWRKADVRRVARELRLPVWDAPASPCLSSRIRYGLPVTPERLAQVEQGERFVRGLGIEGDLRVRHHGAVASIEVAGPMISRLEAQWSELEPHFKSLGFARVELDPRGYRRGSLLPVVEGTEVA